MGKNTYIRKKKGIKEQLSRVFLLIALVVIALIFQAVQPRFLMLNNVMNLLALSSIIGVLALGNMILMAAGEMSFSIGAQCTVIGAVFGKFLVAPDSNNMFLAFLISVAASAAIGLFLAFCTIRIGVPTFVCTLALATVVDGCSQLLNDGTTPVSYTHLIGFFQMLALIPGTSRSGATIVGALIIGVSREIAAEFTFFLAIPAMFGASLIKLIKFGFHFTGAEFGLLMLRCVVSFGLSIVAIRFLMGYIKKHDFKVLGWYRIALGGIIVIYTGVQILLG